MALEKDKWYEVHEDSREYTFPDGSKFRVTDIRRMRVSPNHTHFMEDIAGVKYIVRNTWVGIEIIGRWAIS